MVKMEHKGGATISAHPSKVESLKNMGWTVCGEKPAKKVNWMRNIDLEELKKQRSWVDTKIF